MPKMNSTAPSLAALTSTSFSAPVWTRSRIGGPTLLHSSMYSASQAWKRARLAELGIAAPAHLHHISIDFERQTLGEGLAESIIDLGKPVFIALQDEQLLAEKCHLSFPRRMRSEQSDDRSDQQLQEVDHPSEASPFTRLRQIGLDFR